jgi:hypothetical protein
MHGSVVTHDVAAIANAAAANVETITFFTVIPPKCFDT